MKLKYIVLICIVWTCKGQSDEQVVQRWVGCLRTFGSKFFC